MQLRALLFLILLLLFGCQAEEDPVIMTTDDPPVAVTKTNPTQLYMHYMPWFQSKAYSGNWGIHWTMANQNPDNVLPNGNREIAAHYYPLIGPYDSADPDLVDYHVLLLKYAGVDGVLIDWYGSHEVLDYGINRINASALIAGLKRVGLEYAIVYEEFTAAEVAARTSLTDLQAAQQDMSYMQNVFFDDEEYIQINNRPLLLTFGPRHFQSPGEWNQILGRLNAPTTFMPLWYATDRVGANNAAGEFSWVDFNPALPELDNFYQNNSNGLIIGSAYPGFHDFYQEGGWGDSYGFVDLTDGLTLQNTLDKAAAYDLPYLQLVTWNDFGEGTMFEPTQEFEFLFIEMLQDFAGVPYDKAVFEQIYDYYLKRKALASNASAQETLDAVFRALNQLEVERAASLLDTL
jgi:glycoprotein endo-alpha-1,2-mannosidase